MNALSSRLLALILCFGCNEATSPTTAYDTPADKPDSSPASTVSTRSPEIDHSTPLDSAEATLPRAIIVENRTNERQIQSAKQVAFPETNNTPVHIPASQQPIFKEGMESQSSESSTAPELHPYIHISSPVAAVGAGYDAHQGERQYGIRTHSSDGDIEVKVNDSTLAIAGFAGDIQPNLTLKPVRTAYDTGDTAHMLASVTTASGTPLFGVTVTGDANATKTDCTTDEAGICVLTYPNLPADTIVTASIGSETSTATITVNPVEPPTGNTIGIHLPTTLRTTGETFSVPVYLSSTNLTPGAYDMRLMYSPMEVEVTGIEPGSCDGMGAPVSNLNEANQEGTLRFNAIGFNPDAQCLNGSGPAHVATIHLKVIDGSIGATMIECAVKDYLADNFSPLGTTCTGGGQVLVGEPSPNHFVFVAADTELDDRYLLDGSVDETQLYSRLVWSDGTITAPHPALQVSGAEHVELHGTRLKPGSTPGVATIVATAGAWQDELSITTRSVTDLSLVLADDVLEVISGTNTVQPTRLQALAHWNDGSEVFVADVTNQVESRILLPVGFELNAGVITTIETTPGESTISLPGIAGAPTVSAQVVRTNDTVALEGITVFPVCSATAQLDALRTTLSAQVISTYTKNVPCTLQTQAWFSDGATSVVPVTLGVSHTSDETVSILDGTLIADTSAGVRITSSWNGATVDTDIASTVH